MFTNINPHPSALQSFGGREGGGGGLEDIDRFNIDLFPPFEEFDYKRGGGLVVGWLAISGSTFISLSLLFSFGGYLHCFNTRSKDLRYKCYVCINVD